MINKNKKRITITLNEYDLKRLEEIKEELYPLKKTKSKIISNAIYEKWINLCIIGDE